MSSKNHSPEAGVSFYEQPHVTVETIPVGEGVLIGTERVFNSKIGIGGAYGTWGIGYDNEALRDVLRSNLGETFSEEDQNFIPNNEHLQQRKSPQKCINKVYDIAI